jgi:predicted aspartyl protease
MKVRHGLRKRLLIPLAILLSTDCLGAIVIPIEIEEGNAIASARINGVQVKLVIDSGGGVVVLKPETARKVGAARADSTRSTTDARGIESTQAVLTLNTLELGGSNFSNVEAAEYSGEVPRDGSIGRALLNQFMTIYDYSSRKITLVTPGERTGADEECRGTAVRTIPHPEGVIVSMAEADHRAMRMMWDTGATNSFVKKTFADRHKLPENRPSTRQSAFRWVSKTSARFSW